MVINGLRSFREDVLHCLRGRWFWAACVLSGLCLWFGLEGISPFSLRDQDVQVVADAVGMAFTSKISRVSLPLVSALPCAGMALSQLQSGAFRPAVFRCGFSGYSWGKIFSSGLGAMLSQLLASGVFCAFFLTAPNWRLLLSRLLAACLFAQLGGIAALVSGDAVVAYVTPVAVCFSLELLQARFFTGWELLSPAAWLTGAHIGLCAVLAAVGCGIGYAVLRRELRRRV